jgi:hypothetical protein
MRDFGISQRRIALDLDNLRSAINKFSDDVWVTMEAAFAFTDPNFLLVLPKSPHSLVELEVEKSVSLEL